MPYMHNFQTGQIVEIEDLNNLTAEQGRSFVPRIDLGPGMMGDGPAVSLYEVLVAQGKTPLEALTETLRAIVGTR